MRGNGLLRCLEYANLFVVSTYNAEKDSKRLGQQTKIDTDLGI